VRISLALRAFAPAKRVQDTRPDVVRRHRGTQIQRRLPHRFVCRPAEHLLGVAVPEDDLAIEVGGDHRFADDVEQVRVEPDARARAPQQHQAPDGAREHQQRKDDQCRDRHAGPRPVGLRQGVPAAIECRVRRRADVLLDRQVEPHHEVAPRRRHRDGALHLGERRRHVGDQVVHARAAREGANDFGRKDERFDFAREQTEERFAHVAVHDRLDVREIIRKPLTEIVLDDCDPATDVVVRHDARAGLAHEDADVERAHWPREQHVAPGDNAEVGNDVHLARFERVLQQKERRVDAVGDGEPGALGDGIHQVDGEARRPAALAPDVVRRPVLDDARANGVGAGGLRENGSRGRKHGCEQGRRDGRAQGAWMVGAAGHVLLPRVGDGAGRRTGPRGAGAGDGEDSMGADAGPGDCAAGGSFFGG